MISSKSDVEKFLVQVRKAIDAGLFIPINRKKNLCTLAILGITWKDAKNEIKELGYEHYVTGPERDRDISEPDPLWIFKKDIDSQTVYIKIKICYSENGELKVLSFHIDFMTD